MFGYPTTGFILLSTDGEINPFRPPSAVVLTAQANPSGRRPEASGPRRAAGTATVIRQQVRTWRTPA